MEREIRSNDIQKSKQNEVIKYINGVQTFDFLVNKLMMHVF